MRNDRVYLFTLPSGSYPAIAPVLRASEDGRQLLVFLTPASAYPEHSFVGQITDDSDAGATFLRGDVIPGTPAAVPFTLLTREAVAALTPDQCPDRDWLLLQGDTTDDIQEVLIQQYVPDGWVEAQMAFAAEAAPT